MKKIIIFLLFTTFAFGQNVISVPTPVNPLNANQNAAGIGIYNATFYNAGLQELTDTQIASLLLPKKGRLIYNLKDNVITFYNGSAFKNLVTEDIYTTLSNYATNASLSNYALTSFVNTQLATKQNNLISGTNIKTINGYSVLGSGTIYIPLQVNADWNANSGVSQISNKPTIIAGTGTANFISKWTGTTALSNSIIFDNGTNIGIGNSSPTDKLTVGTITTQNTIKVLGGATANLAPAVSFFRSGSRESYIAQSNNGFVFGNTGGMGAYTDTNLDNNSVLILANTGNIGVGTINPTAKLEIAGQIKITGGSPSVGKVLTTDANGLATWQTTPSSTTPPIVKNFMAATGTYNPTAGLKYAIIELYGGGGAGGGAGAGSATSISLGGGGGAGGYSKVLLTPAQIGASVSITIGAGGVGVLGSNGGSGGITSFGSLATATGGSGGATVTATTTCLNRQGGQGGSYTITTGVDMGSYNTQYGGYSIGYIIGANAMCIGGAGANTSLGIGGQAVMGSGSTTTSISNNGNNGNGFGVGGSGAYSTGTGSTAKTGGNGSSGKIIITEYF